MINVFDTQDGNAPISFAADKEQPAAETTHKSSAGQPVHRPAIDFGPVEDKTHGLIKVVGVGVAAATLCATCMTRASSTSTLPCATPTASRSQGRPSL